MLDFPDMSDEEWEASTPEKQDAYNHKINLRNEYKFAFEDYQTSMSLTGPGTLMVVGIILALFYWPLGVVMIAGGVWILIRVISRSHAYQRYKDTEAAFKEVM